MKRGRLEVLTIVLVLLLVLVGFSLFDVLNEKLSKKEISGDVVDSINQNNQPSPTETERIYPSNIIDKNGLVYNKIMSSGSINPSARNNVLIGTTPEGTRIFGNGFEDFNGYIVEFKDEPVLVKQKKLKEQAGLKINQPLAPETRTQLTSYKQNLKQKQNNFINSIEQKDAALSASIQSQAPQGIQRKPLKIMNQFTDVFNGLSIDATQDIIEEIKKMPEVKRVVPNYKVNITLMDSVPLINADDVWLLDEDGNQCATSGKECLTGKGVTIGIIDTGVDYTHLDLGGCTTEQFLTKSCAKVVDGYDFSDNDNDPIDYMGHGTHVAATAAGNGILKGVAPDAGIYAYKVFPNSYSDVIISAIERSMDPNQDGYYSDHLDVISLSLGGYGDPDDPMSKAIDNAVDNGIVAVISAGNSGPREQTIGSPGTARKAITVGATDKQDQIASFSSRGPVIWTDANGQEQVIIKPDVVAPGVNICAAQWDSAWSDRKCLDDKHISISGTSMATPHVSGAVALLLQKHPDWIPEEIKASLKGTVLDLGLASVEQGYGRIDILKTVKLNNPLEIPWELYMYFEQVNNVHDIIKIKGIFPEVFGFMTLKYREEGGLEYRTNGLTIIDQNGVIAEFSPEGNIDQSGNYEFSLAITKEGVTKTFSKIIYFDSTLKEGWPKTIFSSNLAFISQPTIADVDRDGNKDILITYSEDGLISPNLLAYNYKGEIINSLSIPGSSTQFGSIYSDYDQNDNSDVLFVRAAPPYSYRYLTSFSPSNNEHLSTYVLSPGFGDLFSYDLDLDRFNEIMFVDWGSYLYFYDDLRSNSQSFSKPLFSLDDCTDIEHRNDRDSCLGVSSSDPFYLNVDGDPEFEILANTYIIKTGKTTFYAFNIDGSIVEGFPKIFDFPLFCSMEGRFYDHIQIFCIRIDDMNNMGDVSLYLINNDFSFIESEKINLMDLISEKNDILGITFGSFDGKDYFVIIARDNLNYRNFVVFISAEELKVHKIYSLPVLYNSQFYPIGNFNGKNYIFAGSTYDGEEYFVNLMGEQLKFRNSISTISEVISDIDDDGLNELISVDRNGKIYVRDLNGNSEKEWGEPYYDPQHTGCYDCDKLRDPNKVYIKNQGQNVAWFGDRGNIVLKGPCQVKSNCIPPADSFIFKNSAGDVVAYIDTSGNLCIETGDCSPSSSCSATSNDEFIMQDETGKVVSKIDLSNGDLCYTGKIMENGSP